MATTQEVKDYLIDNRDKLEKLLKGLGFESISIIGDELRCAYTKGSNPTATVVDLKTMRAKIFSQNVSGDIYSLIQFKTKLDFKKIHKLLTKYCGLNDDNNYKVKKKFYDGFFDSNYSFTKEVVYEESVLNKYEIAASYRFFKDGIDPSTQRIFGVRYDHDSSRIVIPWRNEIGELVGTTGRYNYDNDAERIPKYMTLERFRKGNYLFGLHVPQIRNEIFKKDEIILVEAEKSTMKAFQMGVYNCVAVGSHSLSTRQINTIKTFCENVVIAFDEDVEEDILKNTSSQLKSKNLNVTYIYDADRKYLRRFQKESPFDVGKEKFKMLYEQRVTFIE